jgi:hypothetical protein
MQNTITIDVVVPLFSVTCSVVDPVMKFLVGSEKKIIPDRVAPDPNECEVKLL